MRWLLFLLLLLPPSTSVSYKYKVAIASIFQNEAPYLREWIEFHKLVGVEHFYLYNNLSQDNYIEVLRPYIQKGEVDLVEWNYTAPNEKKWSYIQKGAYLHALKSARYQTEWLAFLDTDEFLFPVEVDTLPVFLQDYHDAAGVVVNWQLYGTSNVSHIPPGSLLIEELLLKAPTLYPENLHVKSIVRPSKVDFPKVHFCRFLPGFAQVNANKEPTKGSFSPISVDKIRINHYWTRDEHYFETVKVPRREKWGDELSYKRRDLLNQEKDPAILKYADRLKKVLL